MSVNKVLDSRRFYQSALSSALGSRAAARVEMHLRTPRLGVVWDSVINYYPLKNLTVVHGWSIRWCNYFD